MTRSIIIIINLIIVIIIIMVTDKNELLHDSVITSREGQVKSPNYPRSYSDDSHFRLHIIAPNSSASSQRLVVRFRQVDIEYQENCLYDYIGLQSTQDGDMHRICGHHSTNLERYYYYFSILLF